MPRKPGRKTVGAALIPGMRMDPELEAAFRRYAESMADAHDAPLNFTAAGRDLLRRALKMAPEHSCKKEGYHRGVAEAKRLIADAIASSINR